MARTAFTNAVKMTNKNASLVENILRVAVKTVAARESSALSPPAKDTVLICSLAVSMYSGARPPAAFLVIWFPNLRGPRSSEARRVTEANAECRPSVLGKLCHVACDCHDGIAFGLVTAEAFRHVVSAVMRVGTLGVRVGSI